MQQQGPRVWSLASWREAVVRALRLLLCCSSPLPGACYRGLLATAGCRTYANVCGLVFSERKQQRLACVIGQEGIGLVANRLINTVAATLCIQDGMCATTGSTDAGKTWQSRCMHRAQSLRAGLRRSA